MITGMVPNFESETFRIETYYNERREDCARHRLYTQAIV
jgi:hypothetical protein